MIQPCTVTLKLSAKDSKIAKVLQLVKKSDVTVSIKRNSVFLKADSNKAKKTLLAVMKIVDGYELSGYQPEEA